MRIVTKKEAVEQFRVVEVEIRLARTRPDLLLLPGGAGARQMALIVEHLREEMHRLSCIYHGREWPHPRIE